MARENLNDNYYERMQISSNATFETVDKVYRILAKKYHPDNLDTGDMELFDAITKAHGTLSDPEKRAAYDAKYIHNNKPDNMAQNGISAGNGFETDFQIRRHLLSILYIDRRENPLGAGIGDMELERLVDLPENSVSFHIWYLGKKGWIERTEGGSYAITATGVDEIERVGLVLGKDLMLPESTVASDDRGEEKAAKLIRLDVEPVESNGRMNAQAI